VLAHELRKVGLIADRQNAHPLRRYFV
jgi:hypothetical protein